jgi:hypothetical protein
MPSTTNLVGGLDPEGDALGRGDDHGWLNPERELQVAAPGLHPVADADDLQGLAVAVGDAGDHVGDQRARQSVQRAHRALVVRPGDLDDPVLAHDVDGVGHGVLQGALRALHGDLAPVDLDLYPAGDGHGEPPDP